MHENTVSVQINKIIFNNNLKHLFFILITIQTNIFGK